MASFEPTWESLDTHAVPEWYHDAKLGIFIHWGVYAVPAYADPDGEHAYAEWYPYYMYREGSDTAAHHHEHYGNQEYIEFADEWNADAWDPASWAGFFDDVGAGYVVLTAEHHDGFPLWPSHYTRYNAGEMGPERDIVGELASAVRAHELKFAGSYHANLNYYQPGFSGPFGHPAYRGSTPFEDAYPETEYVEFMNAKHRELIRRYDPDLLWFDTPQADAEQLRAKELIADYYNHAAASGKEVLVNDRASTDHDSLAGHDQEDEAAFRGDFATPEYTSFDEIKSFKWETCRGIGNSFGFNAAEGPEHHLSARDLIHMFVDVVSKNGNLLINVGPRADGTIPELQKRPLEGLGTWLADNGDAIFGTRPWFAAEDSQSDVPVRYTHDGESLFATAFEWPDDTLRLRIGAHADTSDVTAVRLLGEDQEPSYETTSDRLTIDVTGINPPEMAAYSFEVRGVAPAAE